jgi:hypothetical protein
MVGALQVAIPDCVIDQAKSLREAGLSWSKISKILGFNRDTLRIRVDPEFRLKKAAEKREYSKAAFNLIRRSNAAYMSCVTRGVRLSDAELNARRALIPHDTRDLTARICGDPIPGDPRRSAA